MSLGYFEPPSEEFVHTGYGILVEDGVYGLFKSGHQLDSNSLMSTAGWLKFPPVAVFENYKEGDRVRQKLLDNMKEKK